MESYQWQYQPTPEEINKSKKAQKAVAYVFWLITFVLIYYVFYVDNISERIVLGFFALANTALWILVVKRALELGTMNYVINDEGIEMTNLKTNRKRMHKWDKMISFSTKMYMRTNTRASRELSENKHLYIATGRRTSDNNSEGVYRFITLMVTENRREKVKEILKQKLTEWKG